MIKQIKFVSIPVADQNRALDFYTEKLGFTIITDQPFDKQQRWIELRIPKAETRLARFTPEGRRSASAHSQAFRTTARTLRRHMRSFPRAASFSKAHPKPSPGAPSQG